MLKSNGGKVVPYFKWGVKKGVGRTNKNVQFFESFTYEGIEYRLFDCAYFFVDGQCETSIGKLVRMYETSTGEKLVKVMWFFRPSDIRSFLGGYEPQWDELFLACGDEEGVYNINNVDAIIGKCNVLCDSEDQRNPRPSRNDLRNANYVFSRTFDTKRRIISKHFPDGIAGIGVEKLFNKIRDKQPLKPPYPSGAASTRSSPVKSLYSGSGSTKLGRNDNRDGKLISRPIPDRSDPLHVKKNPLYTESTSRDLKTKTRAVEKLHASGSSLDPHPSKKRKLKRNTPERDVFDDSAPQPREQRLVRNPPLVEKAPSQNIDKNSWYKKLPFEEELKAAMVKGRWLLIENLEPSFTSLEVEDLCRQAFNERVNAKMIPSSNLSSPHIGRALVIFGTTKAADYAMSRLTEGCLMLSDQRPLVGSRTVPKDIGECRSFTGHFSLVRKGWMSFEKRKAVATSHCAQSNHIVCHMALQWFGLQRKSELILKRLFKQQAKEINNIKSKKYQETRR
ncbi:unnamed protein product [Arabis nemorensis]|uniref:BAH domain-containing protein n=1 Tax=Arabis nemorensis TaxID=586526 RepID=A0A565B7Z8_9BRAS|nr:unnamed protein product [Arabis nemorensis]